MSDLTKILTENQREMLKLIAPMTTKKCSDHHALENFDSEPENISVARTSTPVKTKATTSKTTQENNRNNGFLFFGTMCSILQVHLVGIHPPPKTKAHFILFLNKNISLTRKYYMYVNT